MTLLRQHLEVRARVLEIPYEGKTDEQLEAEVLDALSGPARAMEERRIAVLKEKDKV